MTGSPFEVVVVTYQSAPYIRPCLRSLRKTGGIVVVDNDSRDQTREIIAKEFPEVRLISARKNLGYARALNLGIAQTSSPIVVAANADTVFPAGSWRGWRAFSANTRAPAWPVHSRFFRMAPGNGVMELFTASAKPSRLSWVSPRSGKSRVGCLGAVSPADRELSVTWMAP